MQDLKPSPPALQDTVAQVKPGAAPALAFGERIAIFLSTAGGIGFAPVAPGTFGSLPGLAIGVALAVWNRPWMAAAILVTLTALSYWMIAITERAWKTHDDQRIVIDEVCGQAIAMAFLAPTWPAAFVAFIAFRTLDITKPLAIGWIDREAPGAAGTLFDDILAGVVAAAVLWPFLH